MEDRGWEGPDQWLSTLFPTKMYSLDPLRARRRGSQVCSIGKVGGGQPPCITDGETGQVRKPVTHLLQ